MADQSLTAVSNRSLKAKNPVQFLSLTLNRHTHHLDSPRNFIPLHCYWITSLAVLFKPQKSCLLKRSYTCTCAEKEHTRIYAHTHICLHTKTYIHTYNISLWAPDAHVCPCETTPTFSCNIYSAPWQMLHFDKDKYFACVCEIKQDL